VKSLPLVDCCAPLAATGLTDTDALELERLFRALGDRHRVKILNLIFGAAEPVCVCELVPALGLAQPTVSYHLKQLTDAGLLLRERRGTYAFYRVAPEALERVRSVFAEPGSGPPRPARPLRAAARLAVTSTA
jgi:ArsR family transcriptional regulator